MTFLTSLLFFVFGLLPYVTINDKAEALLQKAESYEESRQLDSATAYYAKASLAFAEKGNSLKSVRARKSEADLYFRARNSKNAIATYHLLLDTHGQSLSDTLKGDIYYNMGISHARLAKYIPALENIKKANLARMRIYPFEDVRMADTYHTLGRLYFVIGDYQRSLKHQQKFMEIFETNYPTNHERMAEPYLYVGLSYSRLYEHDLALQYYQQSLAILLDQESKNFDAIASVYNNIGLVYGRKGEITEELDHLRKALAVRRSDNPDKATNYHNIGRAYYDLKEYRESLQYLHRAAALKRTVVGPTHSTVASSYNQLGIVYRAVGQYDSSLYFLRKSLDIENNNYGRYGIPTADASQEIAETYHALELYDSALMYYQKAIGALVHPYDSSKVALQPTDDQEILDKRSLARLLHQKSELLSDIYDKDRDEKMLKLAYQTSSAAVDMIEQIFTQLNDQGSFAFLAENANSIYEHNLELSVLLQQIDDPKNILRQSFAVLERNKARLLLQNTSRSRAKNTLADSDTLLAKESELLSQRAYFEKMQFEERTITNPDSVRLDEIRDQLFAIRQELDQVEQELKTQHPQKHQMLHQAQYAQLEDIQKLLGSDEVILEYFEGQNNFYGMAISQQEVELVKLGNKGAIRKATQELTTGLRQKDYQLYAANAHLTYLELISRFQLLKKNSFDKLVIIPDGRLGYVPFEALLSSPPPNNKAYHRLDYLIKKHTIAYQYSASLLAQADQDQEYETSFIGYAPKFDRQSNPLLATRSALDAQLVSELEALPYARQEVTHIANLLKGEAFIADQATESHFKQTAHQGKILHLASHTLINDRDPLYSRLVFAPQQEQSEDDGLLHTYELYNMELKADMVTLSACNTGLGKIEAGEGIVSLARGFMYAGVSNVLMSLWSVSDQSTSQLMQYFYESLNEGQSKAESLRSAKLKYLETADANTAAPYYWSAFVLISSENVINHTSYLWYYVALAALIGTVMLWALLRR